MAAVALVVVAFVPEPEVSMHISSKNFRNFLSHPSRGPDLPLSHTSSMSCGRQGECRSLLAHC